MSLQLLYIAPFYYVIALLYYVIVNVTVVRTVLNEDGTRMTIRNETEIKIELRRAR